MQAASSDGLADLVLEYLLSNWHGNKGQDLGMKWLYLLFSYQHQQQSMEALRKPDKPPSSGSQQPESVDDAEAGTSAGKRARLAVFLALLQCCPVAKTVCIFTLH